MRINDFNEILEKYDFFESIIDEVYFEKALTSCKKDNIINAHIEIDSFELMRENDLIHIIIKNQYGDLMFDIICENIFIDV